MKPALQRRRVLSASTVLGDRVRNQAGDHVGKIEELMIDVSSGKIAYAVLAREDDRLQAVPWGVLSVDESEGAWVVNVDREVFERAPGFERKSWPDMTDIQWGNRIFSYYGYRPYWD